MNHKYKISLPKKINGLYRFNYDLGQYSWFKTSGKCDVFFKPKDLDDLCYFISELNKSSPNKSTQIFILGNGSNVLIRDSGFKGIAIKLGNSFSYIKENNQENELIVGASCLNYSLSKYCLENAIPNFEFLVGIPGTIGGGIAMNAGCYSSEFKDIIKKVKAVDRNGNILIIEKDDNSFIYRGNNLPKELIFVEATFGISSNKNLDKVYDVNKTKNQIKEKIDEISSQRQRTQPIKERTCGSTFRNPKIDGISFSAWKLIDECGMRGYSVGGAKVSETHPNFLINYNNASSDDIENLIEEIREKVLQKFNIDLHLELKIIG